MARGRADGGHQHQPRQDRPGPGQERPPGIKDQDQDGIVGGDHQPGGGGHDDGAAGDPGPPLDHLIAQPQGEVSYKEQHLGHRGQGKCLGEHRGLPQGQGQEQDQGNGHQVDQDAQEGDHLEVEGHQGGGGQTGHHRHHKPFLDPEQQAGRWAPYQHVPRDELV